MLDPADKGATIFHGRLRIRAVLAGPKISIISRSFEDGLEASLVCVGRLKDVPQEYPNNLLKAASTTAFFVAAAATAAAADGDGEGSGASLRFPKKGVTAVVIVVATTVLPQFFVTLFPPKLGGFASMAALNILKVDPAKNSFE